MINSEQVSLPGVYRAVKKNGEVYYRASFNYKCKHISLGSFDDEETAHRVYRFAQLTVSTPTLRLEDYSPDNLISFEKWVVIINFRDNNIYFSNPIYVRANYFSYYLSLHEELKFSIDDLFYYSSHKIMRRGGHLFVADYGMQVSIVSRYGIKSHAVEERDYRFINGDKWDYRYENIEVFNEYHGVSFVKYRGKPGYKAVVHVVGDYVIGHYHTAIEAAIAVNKAIDVLHSNGINKAFKTNFIEDISPSAYANIYSELKISEKIAKLSNIE
ncbi:MAG: hypothetical protein KBT19_07615 [Lachnospiraceae bacterium]|nr:hypothetical protein [Candidatus Colinaster equi]